MLILINLSNLKIGGGLQVASSFVNVLKEDHRHRYIIVMNDKLTFVSENFGDNFTFIKVCFSVSTPIQLFKRRRRFSSDEGKCENC